MVLQYLYTVYMRGSGRTMKQIMNNKIWQGWRGYWRSSGRGFCMI